MMTGYELFYITESSRIWSRASNNSGSQYLKLIVQNTDIEELLLLPFGNISLWLSKNIMHQKAVKYRTVPSLATFTSSDDRIHVNRDFLIKIKFQHRPKFHSVGLNLITLETKNFMETIMSMELESRFQHLREGGGYAKEVD